MGFTAACIYDLKLALQTHMGILPAAGDITVIFVGPMFVTNALSTLRIAWKAWYVVWLFISVLVQSHDEYRPRPPRDYHQTVGAHFRKGGYFGHVEKVLVLLVESGFIYLIVGVIGF
jgi:hypothetical protein